MIHRIGRAALDIFIGLGLIAVSVVTIRFALLPAISTTLGWDEATTSIVRRSLIILTIALTYWLFVKWRVKSPVQDMTFAPWPIILSGAAGIFFIGLPIIILFSDGSYTVETVQFDPSIMKVALFIFSAAFLEEVLFRGILFTVIERHFGIKAALILPSILFSLLHFFNAEWAGILPFLAGLLLGLFWALNYAWVRNIWAVAANHALWNFTIVLAGLPLTGQVDWLEISPLQTNVMSGKDWWNGGTAGPENTVLTVSILAIVVAWMLWRQFRRVQ